MPAAIPMVAAAFVAVGSAATAIGLGTAFMLGATAVTWGAVLSVTGLALMAVSALTMKTAKPSSSGGQLDTKLDPKAPVPVLYGRSATGGYAFYRETYGSKNKYAAIAVALSVGPILGINSYIANDRPLTFYGDPHVAVQNTGGYNDSKLYRGRFRMRYQRGETPAAQTINEAAGGGLPKSPGRLSGIAHAIQLLDYDSDQFPQGMPKSTWVASGVKLYDPRKDSTYLGGSGPQRRANHATWEYSENPYLAALDWTLGRFYNARKVYGIGAKWEEVDVAAFVAGANIADANGWTVGGVVVSTDDKMAVLGTLLESGGGVPIARGAQISVLVNAPKVSTLTLTSADIIGEVEVQNSTSWRDRNNTVVPSYREESQLWEIVAGETVSSSVYVEEDGGETKTIEVEYPLVQQAAQAHQLAVYELANGREFLTMRLTCGVRMLGAKVGEAITVNLPEANANGQKCLVVSREINPTDYSVTLGLKSETDAKHPFALGQSQVAPPSPALDGYNPAEPGAPEPNAWSITATTITAEGVVIPAIVVSGEVDDPNAAAIIVEYRPTGSSEWINWGSFNKNTRQIEITAVTRNTAYDVAVSYRTVLGVTSDRLMLGATAGEQQIDWGSGVIVGDNKPADNATVGAPVGTDVGGKPAEAIVDAITNGGTIIKSRDLQAEIIAAKATIAAIEGSVNADFGSLNQEVDALQSDVLAAAGNISSLQSTASTLNSSVSTLQSDVSAAKTNITNLQSSTSTLNSSVSTLQSDVSAAKTNVTNLQTQASGIISSVNGLDTRITAQGGDISTVNSTLSTQGSSISTLQSTVSNTIGNLASLTTRVDAGTQLNLLKNGGFENGLTDWTVVGAGWYANSGGWGQTALTFTDPGDGAYTYLQSDLIHVDANASYTATADNTLSFSGSAKARIEFRWFAANGTTNVGENYGTNKAVSRDFDTTGLNRRDLKLTSTAPSNAQYLRVSLVTQKDSGSFAATGWRQVKVERGTADTPYSAEASIVQSALALNTATQSLASLTTTVSTQGASITSTSQAVSTLQGSVSTLQSTVATQGSSITSLQTTISSAQGDLATLKTQVMAGGGNLLTNTDLAVDTAGWTFSTNNASVGGRNNPDANWYPSTENTLSIQQDNATATNTAEWTQYIELAGGKWYDVSVYAASLRAGIQIYLQCIDATGAVIATPTSGFIAAAGGGKTLADFPIRSFKTQVPATTVRGRLYLRKWGTLSGNSDSWAWFLRPQVTETLAGSSTPVAYSAGNSRASIVGQATALSTLTSNLATVQSTVSTQGGSISTLQSSMTNANGSISTLQSTVSTQGGSISTLQSSVTTVQGSVSTLQSTVSTQGASITSLQSTTSSLTGNVASLTTRVNASQSNLLANGGLENIFVGANYTSSFAWTNSAEWGPIATTTTNGTQTFEFADVTSVQIGATYWISCDPIAFGGSSVYCDLLFLNSSGSTILDGGQNPQAGQFNFSPDDTRRGQIAISAVAPANTSRIRARVVATVVGGAVAGFRRVKVETGPRWTPFSQEAAITSTWSAVNTATSSLATLTTRVGTAEGSITTIQSSLTSANGSISTLQTNVSSLQGSVSTLQSSSTTQAGQISTLQSTVSTQGASITSQGTAITTLQGSVSTLSNVVAASSNPNIISGFENGLSSWFGTSFTISSGPWGSTAYRNANFSGLLFLDSPAVPIFPGAAYTAAADSSLFTTGAGSTRVEILFKNSTGSVVGNPQSSSRYSSPNIDFTNDGSSRATLKASGVAPSGAVTAQVRLTASMTSGSLTSLAWRQPKLEQGGIATPYSGEASAAQTFQAYADLNTSYATLSTTVSSQGGSITTLQSSYTGLNGTVSSLQSTVASQGGSISTLQSTTSTLQGNVSSLTTRVSASQNNLAVNGGLENGYNTGVISAGTYVWNVSAEWGPTATTTVNGTQVFTFAEITNVQVGATYWVHCDAIAYGTSSIYCDLLFYNSSGTLLLDGGQNQQVGTFNFSANDGRRALIAISAVAPAGTTRIRPRVVAEVIGNQITGFRRFKVETGPTWSGFSTEASAVQQAQAITTATGQLSTLSTTVSTQGGFITTLQSSMTTVQGSVSTLQSTVSTQGATISTLQSTTSTLTGSVASLTTRVSAGSNVNMLKNGGFENGLAGWTPTGAGWGSSLGGWGATAATYSNPSDGEYYYLLSDVFAINPGATYTFTADNVMFKSANCWSRVEIIWVGSNGTTEVGHEYGTNKTVQRDYDNNGVNREEMKKTAAAPSNAYFARVSLVTRKDSGTMTVVGWRQAKFETGSVATPYSAEASIVQQYQTLATITGQYASLNSTVGTLNSSVSTQQTAINNLQGRTSAFWQVEAVAGGRAQLRVYADANGGAGVDIGGDLRINGNAMITGTLSVSALNYDMFVKKAHANVSGSPASGQTLMLYNQNMGQAGALGSYSLTVTASFQTNVGTVTSTMSGKPFYTNYLQDGNLIVRLVKNNNIVAEMSWQGDGLYPNSSAMRTVSLADRGKTVEVTDGVAGDLWLQVYAIRGNQDTGVQNGGDYYSRDVSANYQNFSVNAVGKWTFI